MRERGRREREKGERKCAKNERAREERGLTGYGSTCGLLCLYSW